MEKKAKIGLVLVIALIFAVAVPAFAAEGSPEAEAATATDAAGNAVEVVFTAEVDPIIVNSAVEQIGINANEKLSVFDFAITGGTPPYTISIPAGDTTVATIYHYNAETGMWEPLKTWIKDGQIFAITDSASPFALVAANVEIIKGDLLGTGKPSLGSFSILGQYLLGTKELTPEQMAAADMNGDGKVSLADFALLGKVLLGLA